MGKKNENSDSGGFSSIFGFLMVMIGFAVGVGSLWRFPYVCGTNGGALFILVYILVILFVGIPLLTAEMSIGFKTQKTTVKAYQELEGSRGKWHWSGFLHLAAGILIFSYTVPIYSWVLIYIGRTATGFFTNMNAADISASFDALNASPWLLILGAVINWVLVILVVSRGLQGGVERICKIILPVLAVLMVVCIIIGLRIPGSSAGLAFLFKPNPESFTFSSFTAALGQAFFAIGIAMLASMTFGSCIRKKDEVLVKDASIISVSIILAGIAAGLMIFPIVFAFGLEPASGTGLSLITLPNAFNSIAGGRILGTVFYIGFYIAAFSSAISICESVVTTIKETFNISRLRALLITIAMAVVIGVLCLLRLDIFDELDIFTSNYIIVIGAFLISIFVGWIWGADNFLDAANIKRKGVRTWLKVCVKYVCPVAIVVIFLGNFF